MCLTWLLKWLWICLLVALFMIVKMSLNGASLLSGRYISVGLLLSVVLGMILILL